MSIDYKGMRGEDPVKFQYDFDGRLILVTVSREAIEDYYGIESLSDHSNKQKLQENVVAKVLVYISDQESKGRLKEQYQFLTSPVLTQAIGAK